jgi:hypothetical protein
MILILPKNHLLKTGSAYSSILPTLLINTVAYNAFNLKKRLNVSLKYYYQFPFMQNVSFIVGGGYRGQDDYNIYFEDSYAYVQFGIASGLNFLFHKN